MTRKEFQNIHGLSDEEMNFIDFLKNESKKNKDSKFKGSVQKVRNELSNIALEKERTIRKLKQNCFYPFKISSSTTK